MMYEINVCTVERSSKPHYSPVALREAMRLTDEVRQAGESLKAIAEELREHDRRITRLEAKWETAMELAAL